MGFTPVLSESVPHFGHVSNPPKSSPNSCFPLKTTAFCSGQQVWGSQPLTCMREILGTSEAGPESRGLPWCQQEGERPWARENHGINGIWAKSRQAAPGCHSALVPEQPGMAGERKSQPAPAFNPVFPVERLEMPSSWGLWVTGSNQRPRHFWEAMKPGWEAPSESCKASERETFLWAEFVSQTLPTSPRDAGSRVCMPQVLWQASWDGERCLPVWETPQRGKRGENENFLRTAVAGGDTEGN